MMVTRLSRRRFLTITATGLASALGAAACSGDSSPDSRPVARPDLLDAMGAATVRDIGARYREQVPAERDSAALKAAIAQDARRGRWLPWVGMPSLESQIRDDFAAERTVVVSGWVLSITEARQCALFSLGVS